MEVDGDVLHAEFQYCLWAVRSQHHHRVCAANRARGVRAWCRVSHTSVQEKTGMPTQETPRQEPGDKEWPGTFPRGLLQRIITHGPRKLWPQTAEKFLFLPLNHARLSARAGEQIAGNTAEGSNGK